jgi:mRNA deadenylase 3'-5' endonuclease subunit Ccr4
VQVQSDHYEDFYAPELDKHGYTGVYKKKTGEVSFSSFFTTGVSISSALSESLKLVDCESISLIQISVYCFSTYSIHSGRSGNFIRVMLPLQN